MLIDLATVLALVPGLRALRVLRFLRLLRTARIFRYSNPFSGLFRAFESDRFIFGLALAFLLIQGSLGGMSLYLIERNYNPNVSSSDVAPEEGRRSDVQRPSVNRERGLLDRLGECWMRMASPSQVFAARAELHCHCSFGNQVAGLRTEDMHAKHTIGFRVGEDLDLA
jgi:hypothetical protein